MSTVIYPSPIFGPVHSRRLGLSLGINLLPADGKVCSFDCIYCECGFNEDHRPKLSMPSREEVAKKLEERLQLMTAEGRLPDVLTFAGNGEPTCHPHFPEIIDDVIERNPQHRETLAKMMHGETIWVKIYKNISYRDLKRNPDAIWSFLIYTGYLKAIRVYKNENDEIEAEVAIPNREIRSVMYSAMRHWWKDIALPNFDTKPLSNALVNADVETIEREFRLALKGSMSVFDYNEAFYHGMIVGLLRTVSQVHSNDEYGEGRPDVVTVIGETGIILELKCVTPKALEAAGIKDNDRSRIKKLMASKLDEAVEQIHDNEYVEAVLDDEPAARTVKAYAVCFCRKWCMVRSVD